MRTAFIKPLHLHYSWNDLMIFFATTTPTFSIPLIFNVFSGNFIAYTLLFLIQATEALCYRVINPDVLPSVAPSFNTYCSRRDISSYKKCREFGETYHRHLSCEWGHC